MPQITLETSEEVTVSRKDLYQYPPYMMAGNGNKNQYGQSLNLIETLCSFSKPEQFAFMKIYEELDCVTDSRKSHNDCIVRVRSLQSGEQQRFKNGVSSLIQRDIVRRVRREHFRINPSLIITKKHELDMATWNSIS